MGVNGNNRIQPSNGISRTQIVRGQYLKRLKDFSLRHSRSIGAGVTGLVVGVADRLATWDVTETLETLFIRVAVALGLGYLIGAVINLKRENTILRERLLIGETTISDGETIYIGEEAEYEVEKKLAAGGMGELYLAKSLKLGRRVVLKRILGVHSQSEQIIEQLDKECKALAAVKHPNIVDIWDYYPLKLNVPPAKRKLIKGLPGFSMEYVDGITLKERIISGGHRFLECEFTGEGQTVEGLCQAINAGGYGIYTESPENTVDWLNEHWENIYFPGAWLQTKGKDITKLSEELKNMFHLTARIRELAPEELKDPPREVLEGLRLELEEKKKDKKERTTEEEVMTEFKNRIKMCRHLTRYLWEFEHPSLCPKSGRLTPIEAIQIVIQILDGLESAHKAGLVHRDLKPDNIMIPVKGEKLSIKIVDFGIAKQLEKEEKTVAGVKGSPGYMAPEQIKQQETSLQTDFYALTCILWKMLYGEPPHTVDTSEKEWLAKYFNMVIFGPVPEIKDDFISEEHEQRPLLSKVLTKNLNVDPNMRYQRHTELRRDLEALKEVYKKIFEPVTIGPEEPMPTPKVSISPPPAEVIEVTEPVESPAQPEGVSDLFTQPVQPPPARPQKPEVTEEIKGLKEKLKGRADQEGVEFSKTLIGQPPEKKEDKK